MLARKRQLVGIDAQSRGEVLTNADTGDRQIVSASFQRADLLSEQLVTLAEVQELDTFIHGSAVELLTLLVDLNAPRLNRPQSSKERFERGSGPDIELRAQPSVLL